MKKLILLLGSLSLLAASVMAGDLTRGTQPPDQDHVTMTDLNTWYETGTINDGAVTAGKLGSGSVTESKIATNAVSTDRIQDASVTSNKLALISVHAKSLGDSLTNVVQSATVGVITGQISHLTGTLPIMTNAYWYNSAGLLEVVAIGSNVSSQVATAIALPATFTQYIVSAQVTTLNTNFNTIQCDGIFQIITNYGNRVLLWLELDSDGQMSGGPLRPWVHIIGK